jgi:hypothetical protein
MLPDKQSYEVVDAIELAQRWHVPVSWIREIERQTRCPAFAWAGTFALNGTAPA